MINPIAFTFFGISIHWYGILCVISFLSCAIFMKKISKYYDFIAEEDVDVLSEYIIYGVGLGGKIGEFLFFQDTIFTKRIFTTRGGMSFHGALIGCMITLYIYCKRNNKDLIKIYDFTCLSVPIGLFFGRIGNQINNEFRSKYCYLLRCNHPVALYEAFLEGIVLFIILNYKNNINKPLYNTSNAFIYYGIFRSLIEFIRIGKKLYGINISQILSIIMIIIGIIIKLFYKSDHYRSQLE